MQHFAKLAGALARLSVLCLVVGCSDPPAEVDMSGPVAGWPVYGGDAGGSRYSRLSQITPANVASLQVAWVHRSGDYPGGRSDIDKTAFQATPVIDGDTLYYCTPLSRIFALDARTGEERWSFDAKPDFTGVWNKTCRGVALWKNGGDGHEGHDEGGDCSRRVFMGTLDARLVAVDGLTGQSCEDFGDDGFVDLREGLGDVAPGEMYMTSPPTVIGDVVVTGGLVGDNRRVDAPGGVIRGFDVRTGELRWAFDPVPPGTPPPSHTRFHRGTPNAWTILSADPARGLVYVPFGNPSPDFYGGHRDGFDYYGSAVVAVDGKTGEPVWRFQTVHHDLWDYDIASQPVLIDVVKEGRTFPAVAQGTKMGHVFLLDRATGEPLYPVEERPVPQSDVPGEKTSPTQPFPTFPEPLHPHGLRSEDAYGLTTIDRGLCWKQLEALRNEGIFTPPGFEGSVEYPGTAGGANWGSLAFDPERRLLVMTMNRIAQSQQLIRREEMPEVTRESRPDGISLQEGTPYLVRHDVVVSPLGIPCSPPPWGSILALSLDNGKKVWERAFGTTRDMVPFFPVGLDFGMPSMGGPIVTASGVVFIGAAMDDYFRAYDVETGDELWRYRLPAGAQATPMTYRLSKDERQYVVIAAGGHATLRTRLGDSLIAFSLP